MRRPTFSGAVALIGALVLTTSAFAQEGVTANGTWHDDSDGTSGPIVLRFSDPNGSLSGSMRQTVSDVCRVTDEEGNLVQELPITLAVRASIRADLFRGRLENGTWSVGSGDLSIVGESPCSVHDVSNGGSIDGEIHFLQGRGIGQIDNRIVWVALFEPRRVDVLRAQLEEQTTTRDDLQTRLAEKRAELKLQEDSLPEFRTMVKNLELQAKELEKKALLETAGDIAGIATDLMAEMPDQHRGEYQDFLRNQLDPWKAQLAAAEKVIADLRAEVGHLETQLAAAEAAVKATQAELVPLAP